MIYCKGKETTGRSLDLRRERSGFRPHRLHLTYRYKRSKHYIALHFAGSFVLVAGISLGLPSKTMVRFGTPDF